MIVIEWLLSRRHNSPHHKLLAGRVIERPWFWAATSPTTEAAQARNLKATMVHEQKSVAALYMAGRKDCSRQFSFPRPVASANSGYVLFSDKWAHALVTIQDMTWTTRCETEFCLGMPDSEFEILLETPRTAINFSDLIRLVSDFIWMVGFAPRNRFLGFLPFPRWHSARKSLLSPRLVQFFE